MTRVLIVDDSPFNRVTLERLLREAPDFEVVGSAADGVEAMARIRDLAPDVLTLDLEMPNMDGLSLLRWVMAKNPLPVLVVTSRESNSSLFEALELGAIDFVLKPGRVSPRLKGMGHRFVEQLRQVARCRIRVGRKRIDGRRAVRAVSEIGCAKGMVPPRGVEIVVLASSTGGPPALQKILTGLPGDYPAAILVVQHMPKGFTATFARRLDDLCALSVAEARNGDIIEPGRVLVSPGGTQMSVTANGLTNPSVCLTPRQEGDGHVPSADRLLTSVADVYGPNCAGVVLTGMGEDGTRGLEAIHSAGGFCLAESAESAVVFGMPGKAIASGVVDLVLPIESMAPQIQLLVSNKTLGGGPVPREPASDRSDTGFTMEGGSRE
ncbi:MAG: chemotaxis-specific protein-glutamate methyltransferase CheB [Acidobacteriota bacterium]